MTEEMVVHDDIRSGCCGVAGRHRTGCLEVKDMQTNSRMTDPKEKQSGMSNANDIARGILMDVPCGKDREAKIEKAIAAALREEYKRGREECLNEQKCKDCECSYERCCCNPVREAEREAEGYRRGYMDGNHGHKYKPTQAGE